MGSGVSMGIKVITPSKIPPNPPFQRGGNVGFRNRRETFEATALAAAVAPRRTTMPSEGVVSRVVGLRCANPTYG